MTRESNRFTPVQWLLVLACLLVALLIAGLVYTYFDDRVALRRAAVEAACTLQYDRSTDNWQVCMRTG